MSLMILGFSAFFLVCFAIGLEGCNPVVGSGSVNQIVANQGSAVASPASENATTIRAERPLTWTVQLDKDANGYSLDVDAMLVPPIDRLDVTLTNPNGFRYSLVNFELKEPGWGSADKLVSFSVPVSGEWTVAVSGTANGKPRTSAPTGYRLRPAPASTSSLKWRINETKTAGAFPCLFSMLMFLILGLYFVLGAFVEVGKRLAGPKTKRKLAEATQALHESVRKGEQS